MDNEFIIIKNFVEFVKTSILPVLIEKGQKKHKVQKWVHEINEYAYSTEKGPYYKSITGIQKEFEDVDISAYFPIFEYEKRILLTKEYDYFHKYVLDNYATDFEHLFLHRLVSALLEEGKSSDEITDVLVREFKNDKIKNGAFIETVGITLEPDEISLNENIKIIKPTKEKLEESLNNNQYLNTPRLPLHISSAFINLEINSSKLGYEEINYEIPLCFKILRLFQTGGVNSLRYKYYSEAILNSPYNYGSVNGSIYDNLWNIVSYPIYMKDVDRLKKFYEKMHSLFKTGGQNLSIGDYAFDIYSQVIFSSLSFEQQVALTMTGFESIFSDSNQDISRFLRVRISKLMGSLKFKAKDVKSDINNAYEIRSKFVHGKQIDEEFKTKIVKKYGSDRTFLILILNYLRISILAFYLIGLSKESFLELIDDSMIEKQKNEELDNNIQKFSQFIKV